MGKTFWGVVSAAVEQSRRKVNMVAQGDGKFGPWGWPQDPSKPKMGRMSQLTKAGQKIAIHIFYLFQVRVCRPGLAACGYSHPTSPFIILELKNTSPDVCEVKKKFVDKLNLRLFNWGSTRRAVAAAWAPSTKRVGTMGRQVSISCPFTVSLNFNTMQYWEDCFCVKHPS